MEESQAEGFRVEWTADIEKCYRHGTVVRYLYVDDDYGILVDLLDVDGEISSLLSRPLYSLPLEGHLFPLFLYAFPLLRRRRSASMWDSLPASVLSEALHMRRHANFIRWPCPSMAFEQPKHGEPQE